MKLIIVLVISGWVAGAEKEKVLVYGPNTPVYYVGLSDDELKVDTVRNKLPEVEAKYSYDESIHPRVLWVIDYYNWLNSDASEWNPDLNFTTEIANAIRGINDKFNNLGLSNTKVEVLLAGIIFFTDYEEYMFEYYYRKILDERVNFQASKTFDVLRVVRDWFDANKNLFENFSYDMFIIDQITEMCEYNSVNSTKCKLSLAATSDTKFCDNNGKPGAIFGPTNNITYSPITGLGIQLDRNTTLPKRGAVEISYMLGLTHPQDSGYKHWYSSMANLYDEVSEQEWKEQAKKSIDENFMSAKYDCIKKPEINNGDL